MIKMKRSHLLVATSLAALPVIVVATGASANDRYATPPPVVMSPDLTAPWVMQLRPGAAQATPPSSYRQPAQPAVQPVAQRRVIMRRSSEGLRPYQPQASQQAAYTPSPSIERRGIDPQYLPQVVTYNGNQKPGTIVISTRDRFLYLVQEGGTAMRYGVGVGKEGFEWRGTEKITRKAVWPSWRPPASMIEREKKKGRILPTFMEGGPANPLGARALYLGSTLYRIHGTNQPWTIGGAVSSGCIRMRNEDVTDLYTRVGVGTKVVVL